ncbi:DNA helicase B-like isoform X2 [Branchiostoma floridae]|uniref:DNA helicase B-like isoform X2 n=1 Tax=Branchiostoma floridae TaxID=7739 RepID=A0A9J7LSM1_BRAFL|nr:DNA helicase B-like isoform X2 [Branchiostoma floridae]
MYFTTGCPEYRLNQNPDENLIQLFLTKCGVEEQYRKAFQESLQMEPRLKQKPLNFQNLREIVQEYGSLNETAQAVAIQMLKCINAMGKEEAQAMVAPTFLRYGPKLLPKKFYGLLLSSEERLKVLETVTAHEPWKLGFGPIMYQEHQFIGVEATLDAFKRCDLLKEFPPTKRDAIYIYDFIKSQCRKAGHTFVDKESLRLRDNNTLKFLEENKITVQLEEKVALKRYYDYENNIRGGIETLLAKDKISKWVIDSANLEGAFGEDEAQKQAAELICKNPVTVLSGKGGCGKTYVVSEVFKVAHRQIHQAEKQTEERMNETADSRLNSLSGQGNSEADQEAIGGESMPESSKSGAITSPSPHSTSLSQHRNDEEEEATRILLTAPTGKAAHLLGKRTGLKAYTLHQVIWSYRHLKPGDEWRFKHVRALVVDESSLVSVQTFSTLFDILLKHTCLQKLVLLGDVDQLPSIEPGNFLTNMYHSLAPIGWSIELKTNHRSESRLIVDNAKRISQRKLPRFDAERNFHEVPVEGEEHLSSTVTDLLKKGCAKDHKSSQFVAFRRKDCNIINEVCCKHYSGHCTKAKNRSLFQVGDKVCCTKNANISVDPSEGLSDTVRLCNGEIFFITDDTECISEKGQKRRWLTLDDLERQIKVDYHELKSKGGLKHAWARTIHTYQWLFALAVMVLM